MLTLERIARVQFRERTYGSRDPRNHGCPPRFKLAPGKEGSSEPTDPEAQRIIAERIDAVLEASKND